jgi:hypothetical protein
VVLSDLMLRQGNAGRPHAQLVHGIASELAAVTR